MTGMMDRIRDEMAREEADSPISAIGEYVTERIQAGAVVPESKTLKGAYKAMEDWARKNRKGSCCYVPPARAFAIVDEYFGFAAKVPEAKPHTFAEVKPVPAASTPLTDELDLDALLGGL